MPFFGQKHISFDEKVITRVRVYTFRPGKKFLGSTKKGLSLTPNLPGTQTRKPDFQNLAEKLVRGI